MHVPQMSSLKIVLLSFVLLVSAARAATTIQSFTVTGNVVGNSDVSATGMVTINRDPTDTGMESVILGQGFPNVQVTCADGGSANACNIPAGSSVTTFQMKAPNTRDTSTTVTLGITVASSNASASLTINAATYSLQISPNTVVGQSMQDVTTTVTRSPAAIAAEPLSIVASNASYASSAGIPSSLTIPAGGTQASYQGANQGWVSSPITISVCAQVSTCR
jgi:hypothetical protein